MAEMQGKEIPQRGKDIKDVRKEPIRDVAGSVKKVTRGNSHNCKTGNNLAIEDAE